MPSLEAEYFAVMARQNSAPQRLILGPWTHVGMRGTATFTHDVDFGEASVWGVDRYFDEQLEFFNRWLNDDDAGSDIGSPHIVDLFVMGGGSGRRTANDKLDHGGKWRRENEWPLARAQNVTYYLQKSGQLSTEPPST